MRRPFTIAPWFTGITCVILVVGSSFSNAAPSTNESNQDVETMLRFKEGDEAGNEVKALHAELLVRKRENMAIDQLHKILKRHQGTSMEAEILARLAEMYMRRARSQAFFELHRNSSRLIAFYPEIAKEPSHIRDIKKAIEYYQLLQKKWPRYEGMDSVVFNCAYAYQRMGDDKTGSKLFQKVIREFADSPLVADAYFLLAEIHFEHRRYRDALANFMAVQKYPDSRVYPWALYKAAWAHYNLQDAISGAKILESIAKVQDTDLKKEQIPLTLRLEALGDLALFSLEVIKPDRIVSYFRSLAPDLDQSPNIMRVSKLYQRAGRNADNEVVLRSLLDAMPRSEAAREAHESLFWTYDLRKAYEPGLKQLSSLESLCQSEKDEAAKTCRATLADVSKKAATKWHAYLRKVTPVAMAKEVALIAVSTEKAYQFYLGSALQTDPERANVFFAFAELSFSLGKYRIASGLYANAAIAQEALRDGSKKTALIGDKKLAHQSLYASILSLERAIGSAKWPDSDESRFRELVGIYFTNFPKGEHTIDLMFAQALIAYEKNRLDEAAIQFQKLGWNSEPKPAASEKVTKAQDLYLDILNSKKDFRGLSEASLSLIKRSADTGRTSQLDKIYRQSRFSEIQVMEEGGKLGEAVKAYRAFGMENRKTELGAKAWWNASLLQYRIGAHIDGAKTCFEMSEYFPESPSVKECLVKASQTYEALADLEASSRVLLKLAETDRAERTKWTELAADFQALSGQKARAIEVYRKLASQDSAKARHFFEKAMEVARESGDKKMQVKIENEVASREIEPWSSHILVEQAEKVFESGDFTKAFNLSKQIIGRDSHPKDVLARARFIQARVLENEYRTQGIKARVERIGMVLAMKTEKLEKAQKAYQSVVQYGDPTVSVQALKRLAHCYLDYAAKIRDLPKAMQIDANEVQAFRTELDQLAIPMEERGVEALNQALDAARKAQLRDGQISDLAIEVARLQMSPVAAWLRTVDNGRVYLPLFRSVASENMDGR